MFITHFPTHETLSLNFATPDFDHWLEQVEGAVSTYQKNTREELDWKICISFFPKHPAPEVSAHAKVPDPKNPAKPEHLQACVDAMTAAVRKTLSIAPEAMFIEHNVIIETAQSEAITAEAASFFPAFVHPSQAEKDSFFLLPISDKVSQLISWAKNHAVPLLSAYAAQLDIRLKGTRSIGRRLPKANAQYEREAHRKTAGDGGYWKAIIEEMDSTDPLLIAMKIMLHAGHGELDIAWNYQRVYRNFVKKDTLAFRYFEMFAWRFLVVELELEHELTACRAFSLSGDYDATIEQCNRILRIHPQSAAALYERFLAAKALDDLGSKGKSPRWRLLETRIYECDPLFDEVKEIPTAHDAYLATLRKEGADLMNGFELPNKETDIIDELLRIAFISLELGDYALAAHIYFLLTDYRGSLNIEGFTTISFLMFCLDKLKIREITSRYKGNLMRERQLINRYRQQQKENHPAYRDF